MCCKKVRRWLMLLLPSMMRSEIISDERTNSRYIGHILMNFTMPTKDILDFRLVFTNYSLLLPLHFLM